MYNATICRNRLKSRLFWKNRFDPPLWRVMSPHANSCWFTNPSTLIRANYYLGPTQQVHGRRLIFSFSSFPSAISSSCPLSSPPLVRDTLIALAPLQNPANCVTVKRNALVPCHGLPPSRTCSFHVEEANRLTSASHLLFALSLSIT